MGFARVSLSIFFFFCYGKGAFSYFFIFCFEIVILGPPVSHFLFFLLRNTFLEVKILFFASKIMFFSYFFLFLLPEPIFSTRPLHNPPFLRSRTRRKQSGQIGVNLVPDWPLFQIGPDWKRQSGIAYSPDCMKL